MTARRLSREISNIERETNMKFTGRSTQELIRQRDERLALTTRPLVGKDDAGNKQAIREITEELGRRGARQR